VYILRLDSIIFTFHWYRESLHCSCFLCLQVIFAHFLWPDMTCSSQKRRREISYFGNILVMVCVVNSQFGKINWQYCLFIG